MLKEFYPGSRMSERKIIILIFILINLLIIFLGRASTIFVNKDVHEFVLHEAEFFAKAVARSIIHDQAKPGKIVFQGNMETLQDYVSSLYEIDSHDIVIVDEDKKILADVISGDVGHLYNYDSNGEVNKTLDDGITRTFIETSREYPQGIKEIVVPLLTKQKKISGALILEYTPLHENANALISPTINAINRLTVIAMIISILPGFFVLRRSSERRKAEAAVKRSKDFLDKILNTLDDPVFVKDEQHSWVLLNDKACQLMGGARDQLLGRSDYDLFPEDQADEFREKDKLVMETGETNINEEQVKWHGNLHTVATKKSLFIDPETGKKYIVGVTRDITEQNRINLLLQESEYRYRCIFRQHQIWYSSIQRTG